MKILKFGGTSVATPENVSRAVAVIRRTWSPGSNERAPAVVVSALGGVTNGLIAAAKAAAAADEDHMPLWRELELRHKVAARQLGEEDSDVLVERIRFYFSELRDLLHGVSLLRECSPRTLDTLMTYGERMSAELVAAALRGEGLPAVAVDTRELIVTDATFGRAQVDLEVSYPRIRERLEQHRNEVAVLTGFTGATPEGQTTSLGRGGSDYTAALVGAAVGAEGIELWTDVDGVLSADPRQVPDSFPQSALSYAELMELSHFGAKVVYPPTIHPARSAGIPLWIKNTFRPEAAGTRVAEDAPPNEHPIRGIASIHRVAVMRLEGDGMVGVPGIAMRLFGALARRSVSVILISQGSSEHSICFAVAPEDTSTAREAVEEEFALEQRAGLIDTLVVETDQSVVAAVGDQMRRQPGLAGRLFRILGREGISVRVIAQGSSERNISLVVDGADETAALRAIHGAFFHPRRTRLSIALLGPGKVGGAFLGQLQAAIDRLRSDEGFEARAIGIANSRNMVLDADGIDLSSWRDRLDRAAGFDRRAWVETLAGAPGEIRILVDCTASDGTWEMYEELLQRGVRVVAANKRPFAGPLERFRRLRTAASGQRDHLFFEATVGAGLPVLSTLHDLLLVGDRVRRIDGILSGTINAVLDRLSVEVPFSVAVRGAFDEGLTEPRPIDDLNGGDVMRKLCILARLAGHEIEPEEIRVEPLVEGEEWESMSLETFWRELPRLDEELERRRAEAETRGCRLRYLAELDDRGAKVALVAVPPEHPAHGLSGPDNLVAFTTELYHQTPLVIRGPGAGPAVTAAGVFTNVLHGARMQRGS